MARNITRPGRKHGDRVALLWLGLFSMLFGGALHYSAPANALASGARLSVEVDWIGGNCWDRTAIGRNDYAPSQLAPRIVPGCYDTIVDYQFVSPGIWYGIDPNIGDAYAVSCTVTNLATGRIVVTDYARKGDGHNATCLGRWF